MVVATYARLNELAADTGRIRSFQFEVCEKPVLRLPRAFRDTSIVVLDGPFMCVDPLGTSGLFVMGNVVHAIHHRNVGTTVEVPATLAGLLDAGVVQDPPITRFSKFIEAAAEFFVGIEAAEHVGSMFTVRTVLPDTDDTDERPTLVRQLDDRTITIFSGKIGTCVDAAIEAAAIRRWQNGRIGH